MADIPLVGNQPSPYNTPTNTDNRTTPTPGTPPKTGVGSSGQVGSVPPSTHFTYGVVMESLSALMPNNISSDNVSVLISEIAEKLKELQQMTENDKYKASANEKRAQLAEKQQKLDESNEKLQKAMEDKKSGNIIAAIKAFFQMLGALLMGILGGLLSVVPGAQALGGLMIASAVLMAIQTLDGIVKQANGGHGIIGSMIMAATNDPKQAMIGDMAFAGVLAVAALATAVASIAVGRIDSVAQAVKEAVSFGQQVAQFAAQGIAVAGVVVDSIGLGVNYMAAEKTSDAKKLQSAAKEIEALLEALNEIIDAALARMMQAANSFNDTLESVMDAISDRGNTLAKAKFAG